MAKPSRTRSILIITAVAAGAALIGWMSQPDVRIAEAPADGADGAGAEMVTVVLPSGLDATEQRGQAVFAARCAACHGPNAGGIDGSGPPLVHRIYEPGHHADMAFVLAAANGVPSHHWTFGDMPPVEGITRAEVLDVVAFVRRVQQENGIF